jgi:hypothetical protein
MHCQIPISTFLKVSTIFVGKLLGKLTKEVVFAESMSEKCIKSTIRKQNELSRNGINVVDVLG